MSNNRAARPSGPMEPQDSTPDYTVAVSPRQLAGGFAIIAALLVLLLRRRRGRKKG
jgi:hypothetical protein